MCAQVYTCVHVFVCMCGSDGARVHKYAHACVCVCMCGGDGAGAPSQRTYLECTGPASALCL